MQVTFDVDEWKHDLFRNSITQKINLIRDDIQRALRKEMKKRDGETKNGVVCLFEDRVIRRDTKDITNPIKKSNLVFMDDTMQYLKDDISSNKVELEAINVDEKGEATENASPQLKPI